MAAEPRPWVWTTLVTRIVSLLRIFRVMMAAVQRLAEQPGQAVALTHADVLCVYATHGVAHAAVVVVTVYARYVGRRQHHQYLWCRSWLPLLADGGTWYIPTCRSLSWFALGGSVEWLLVDEIRWHNRCHGARHGNVPGGRGRRGNGRMAATSPAEGASGGVPTRCTAMHGTPLCMSVTNHHKNVQAPLATSCATTATVLLCCGSAMSLTAMRIAWSSIHSTTV